MKPYISKNTIAIEKPTWVMSDDQVIKSVKALIKMDGKSKFALSVFDLINNSGFEAKTSEKLHAVK